MTESEATTKEDIWANLKYTEKEENQFRFSICRDRYIVVIGPKNAERNIIIDTIRRARGLKNETERKTKTFLMVPDDETCNVCVIHLIELHPLEAYEPPPDKKSLARPSPLVNIDRSICRFASKIHLIFFVCNANDGEMMKRMRSWVENDAQRQKISALLLITKSADHPDTTVDPDGDQWSARFSKGVLRMNLSSSNTEWQEQFFRLCVGKVDDEVYEIETPTTNPTTQRSCLLS